MKYKNIILNISYTVSSNFLTLVVSTIITLILPKILGVADYGYYQLYLFYTSYVGFLHFGWCDGIYLKYSGKEYNDLDESTFKGQFNSLALFQSIIMLFIIIVINTTNTNEAEKIFVFNMVALNLVILNLKTFCLFILQSTNRMKDYSLITMLDRIVYISLVLFFVFAGFKSFTYYIILDVLAKSISLAFSIYKIKEIIFSKEEINWNIKESIDNIKVGINLMFANIASVLIIGIVRFGIQIGWDVTTFGKISLTLSISNMLLVFVNAISLAIFPLLKKANRSEYSNLYKVIRSILMPTVLVLLMLYYPIKELLTLWLPMYGDSLKYMAIVFPMIVFESKVSLLSNTFLKAEREEKAILKVNLFSAILSFFLTIIVVKLIHNLHLSMLLIVIVLAIRSILSEYVLSKILKVNILKNTILEILMVFFFIFVSWNYSSLNGVLYYSIALLIYFTIQYSEIKETYLYIKK